MKITGNTILITGGGTGIGRALAESFHALGNRVIIAGRRQSMLDEVTRAQPGIESIVLDVERADSLPGFAADLLRRFPEFNVLINNAGIMRMENWLADPIDLSAAGQTVAINLLGPLRLTAALLPALKKRPHAAIVTVSSGLAFLPRADNPTYCATKAAIHSFTQSLRFQLRSTAIQVHEIIPPYVQTELLSPQQATDPNAMPLADFIRETMSVLQNSPDADEIRTGRVAPLRFAERDGTYDAIFRQRNERFAAAAAVPKK